MDENTKSVKMMEESSHFGLDDIPRGFRFLPTDEELIRYYVINKVLDKPLPLNKFIDVNIYNYNPDQLAEIYGGREENEPMYFFSPRERKYANGSRPNRVTGTGHWRATGKDKHIPAMGPTIGFTTALGFHEGKSKKDKKTKWIMHEYRVNYEYLNVPRSTPDQPMMLDKWVLCKIYENVRGPKGKSTDEMQDIPSKTSCFPHHDHADQGGRERSIISSPPRTLLLINQVPPVPNNYDLSNALNSPCQFDQYYSGQMISAFGEHDHHHDLPIAFENTGLHNYANLADDPFFNTNITRPDDHHHQLFAAPVPAYSANSAPDWCDVDDQGRRKDDDDRRGFQLSGPAFNDPVLDYVPLGNPDNFAHDVDDVLIFYDARPSSGSAGDLDQSDQLLLMFDASCDDNQNFDLGSTALDNMFSENKEEPENTEPDRTS
ncbi:NAC domain-containing protein 2-like [Juglans microcarpa x Juglans regia]|uniref:NAC domain-containing protein 2-like n=1 Tax=Juglans microcarpa x Juglans regia TaxID=2249226 RepID=UPI001B7F76E0|nr:NAC domain-containing protein 2-like [Juglans microcarpa x Juglans regia]